LRGLVGNGHDLPLEVAGLLQIDPVGISVAELPLAVVAGVLKHSFPNLIGEIEPWTVIAGLQEVDHAEALVVVFEAAQLEPNLRAHQTVQIVLATHDVAEHLLARVTEGRMTQIMRESDRLNEVLVQTQGATNRSRQLGYFQGVGKPGPVVIAAGRDVDLCLVLEAAKRPAMYNAVAVTLEGQAVLLAATFLIHIPAPGGPGVLERVDGGQFILEPAQFCRVPIAPFA
jgi:hypothetical protein